MGQFGVFVTNLEKLDEHVVSRAQVADDGHPGDRQWRKLRGTSRYCFFRLMLGPEREQEEHLQKCNEQDSARNVEGEPAEPEGDEEITAQPRRIECGIDGDAGEQGKENLLELAVGEISAWIADRGGGPEVNQFKPDEHQRERAEEQIQAPQTSDVENIRRCDCLAACPARELLCSQSSREAMTQRRR